MLPAPPPDISKFFEKVYVESKLRPLLIDFCTLITAASYWEIAVKISIGKLTLHVPYEDFIDLCLNRYGFRVLPIEPAHTARLAAMPFPPNHKDPFDRLLVAQALSENIPIISADVALDPYGVTRIW